MDKAKNDANIDWLAAENRFRATPLDLLKQGLQTCNWQAVSACYLMLTGDKIDPPPQTVNEIINKESSKPKRGRPKKKDKSLVYSSEPASLAKSKELPSYGVTAFEDCIAPAKDPSQSNKIYTKATTHDCSPHVNTWSDDGTIAVNEIVKDRSVPSNILENQRQPWPEFKIKCAACGRVEKVEAGLVPHGLRLTKKYRMSYKCNDCIVGQQPALDLETVTNEDMYDD